MTPKQRKSFWFDQMVNDCVNAFGWREDVAAFAIVTNQKLVEGLLNQQEQIIAAARNIESVFTNLLKMENES